MPVWVINLARSTGRWQHMQNMLNHGHVTQQIRIEAVDGKQLSQDLIDRHYDTLLNKKHYFAPLKTAEIACFLSHRKAWQALLDSPESCVCVLEDDVEFVAPPNPVLQVLKQVLTSEEPRLVKIYASRGLHPHEIEPIGELGYQLHLTKPVILGMQGLCLNRSAAQRLLAFTDRFFEPVDVALQRTWEHGVRIWVIQPNLIREMSAELGGTTLHNQQPQAWSLRLRRELLRPIFRIQRWLQSRLLG